MVEPMCVFFLEVEGYFRTKLVPDVKSKNGCVSDSCVSRGVLPTEFPGGIYPLEVLGKKK